METSLVDDANAKQNFYQNIGFIMLQTPVHTFINTIRRFPIPIICGITMCVLVRLVLKAPEELEKYSLYLSTLATGCYLFTALKLFTENIKLPNIYQYILGIPLFCIIAWYINFGYADVLSKVMLNTGLTFMICTAPFICSNHSDLKLWDFNYRIFKTSLFAGLVLTILLIGLFAIAYAMDILLGIKIYADFYTDAAIVTAGFIAPTIILSSMTVRSDAFVYPSAIRGLLTYAVLPLLYIIGIIIMIYGAKICMNWSLIEGHAVTRFYIAIASSGMLTYIIAYPARDEAGVLGFFVCKFFIMLLVPVFFIGVDAYFCVFHDGITQHNYLKLMLFVWFTMSILFSFLRKSEEIPRFVIGSLAALCLLASFGPWGIANMPRTVKHVVGYTNGK